MYLHDDFFKALLTLQNRINHLLDERLRTVYLPEAAEEGVNWTPPMDIYETEEAIYLTAEVPGLSLEDIRVQVVNNEIILKGSRSFPQRAAPPESYHRIELGSGLFERRFVLHGPVDRSGIQAGLRNGILKVRIPKKAGRPVTRVPIGSP